MSLSVLAKLASAKTANPWWFEAVSKAASIMGARRRKYSGAGDPYTNFVLMARAKGCPVQDIFREYLGIKYARHLMSSGDYADEGELDTDVDLGNYAFLSAGWRLKSPLSRLKAQLAVGTWVELTDLEAALGVDVLELLAKREAGG